VAIAPTGANDAASAQQLNGQDRDPMPDGCCAIESIGLAGGIVRALPKGVE